MERKRILMGEILRDSLIYIDYETLKLPEANVALADSFIYQLINSNGWLIILFKIQQRLKKDKNSIDYRVKRDAIRVERILNDIQAKSNRVKIKGSEDDKDDYMQIYTACYKFIEEKRQVVITNNPDFAESIYKINKQEAVKGMEISVIRIDKSGKLVELFKKG